MIFNIFINDIFYFINQAKVYNYADDNTLSHCDTNINNLKEVLESESAILIKLFEDNLMQANPDKFQSICIGISTLSNINFFKIENTEIPCEESVKRLGVEIDSLLNFDAHGANICKKSARQINVLSRSKYHTQDTKKLMYKCFVRSNVN